MAEKEMVEETKSMMLHLCRLAIEDIEDEYFTKQSIKSGFPVGVSGEQLKAMMDPQCDKMNEKSWMEDTIRELQKRIQDLEVLAENNKSKLEKVLVRLDKCMKGMKVTLNGDSEQFTIVRAGEEGYFIVDECGNEQYVTEDELRDLPPDLLFW